MTRSSGVEALLGPEVYSTIRTTKVLVVGAGGIGCELLKNLVLTGFANIEIIDLDTIDLSNLNRQFLFRKPDISKSKAIVAAQSARHFNPSSGINIHARHGNVKDGTNDLEWISGFGLVMNALDNMDARRHVNRLCMAAGVPLIESGTAGYLGQVTPILRDQTECFDCVLKPAPKSFPVCTLRATPSEPIHCIVWAKSYLFPKLFGEDDEAMDTQELEKAQADGENAEEIENLKKEARAFQAVRAALGEEDGARRVFDKVFKDDLNRLLAMDDMWRVAGRRKPVPLDYDGIMSGNFGHAPLRPQDPVATGSRARISEPNGHPDETEGPNPAGPSRATVNGSASNGQSHGLRDQRQLDLRENLQVFLESCKQLSARAISNPDNPLTFDKDDDDALDFVAATANLRAYAYGIPTKTRFEVKRTFIEMAGNIIPAIATTNAIIAGFIVSQAVHILSNNRKAARSVFLPASKPIQPVTPYIPAPPATRCAVCRDTYVSFKVNPKQCTLGDFIENVVDDWLVRQSHADDERVGDIEWNVLEGLRILALPEFADNHGSTLEQLGLGPGKMITVSDEDDVFRPVHFCLCNLDPESKKKYELPTSAPIMSLRPPTLQEHSPSPDPEIIEEPLPPSGLKRKINDDDETARKRRAPNGDAEPDVPVKRQRRTGDGTENNAIEID